MAWLQQGGTAVTSLSVHPLLSDMLDPCSISPCGRVIIQVHPLG